MYPAVSEMDGVLEEQEFQTPLTRGHKKRSLRDRQASDASSEKEGSPTTTGPENKKTRPAGSTGNSIEGASVRPIPLFVYVTGKGASIVGLSQAKPIDLNKAIQAAACG